MEDPWVNEYFHKWLSLIRMLYKDFLDQILIFFGAPLLEFYIALDDFTSNFDLVASEWSSPMD